jgi:plastocyanin
MTSLSRLTFGILLAASTAFSVGCSDSSNNPTPGTGGTGGGGGGGGTGADPAFMAFAPCSAESSYTTTGTTIEFGGAVGFEYSPKCLKVSAGATVTFNGDFTMHPLAPSAARGAPAASNPIVNMSNGTTAPFTFPTAGFYAYLCNFHGSDDGQFMSGVIWVK